jgi:predicted dehydrogenase
MMARLRMGLVGLNFGRHIIDALTAGPAQELVELAHLCDQDSERVRAAVDRTGVRASLDLDDLLADSSLEAVGLFTGPGGRADLIRRIIRAGKHVMTTKPFERDADAALDVLLEARRLERVVHLNSPAPLLPPDLRQVRQWQETLDLGRPIACRRDVWAGYRERPDGSWQDDPERCPVAPIFRLGIYLINDMIRLLGPVESVQVMQSRIFTGRPTADTAQLSLQFASGAIGNVFASFCVDDGQPYRNAMVLNFERGTVYQNTGPCRSDAPVRQAQMSVVTKGHGGVSRSEQALMDEVSGQYQWDVFCRAIRGERLEGEITPVEVVAGLRVIEAMARAARSGATERV